MFCLAWWMPEIPRDKSSLALPQRSCFELALRVVIAPDSLIMVFDIVLRLFKARLLRESQSIVSANKSWVKFSGVW
jgi:hypothetical protein